jgi:hypothetical protein
MYGFGLHPLLNVLAVAGGVLLGFMFATDPRGPLARMSPLAKMAGLVVAAYFGIGLLVQVF